MRSRTGELWLTPVYGDAVEEAGNFAVVGVGWYRVRVQARGRSEGRDGSGVEEHALSVWPAPPEPDRVLVVDEEARGHDGGQRRPYGGDPDRALAEPVGEHARVPRFRQTRRLAVADGGHLVNYSHN